MSTYSIKLYLLILTLLFTSSIQQLALPLHYSQHDSVQDYSSTRHNLIRQQHKAQEPNQWSRFAHNLKYFQHLANNPQDHYSHHSHNLNQDTEFTHFQLQTFNLQPRVFSFTLLMKIAGLHYKMGIDSGSSDIWIKGENSQGEPTIRYKCGQSCIDKGDHYTVGYLDGRLKTYQTKLQVELGKHKFNESILVVYQNEKNFKSQQGLVGLSFAQLARNPNPSFLQTLKNNKIIEKYAFGVNLNFQQRQNSYITFGAYDPKFFEGQLDFIPLTSNLFYYVKSDGVYVGDSELMAIKRGLFDTGNTCISIPVKYQNQILNSFNANKNETGNYCYFQEQSHAPMFSVLKCKVGNFNKLPDLIIQLNGKKYPIKKQYYMQACDRRPKDAQQGEQTTDGVYYCDMYIESVKRMNQLFLGDGFFNRYYTYFDIEQKKIGIAENKQVITVQRIIRNKLRASSQTWKTILTNLNPNQDEKQISKQVKQNLQEKE